MYLSVIWAPGRTMHFILKLVTHAKKIFTVIPDVAQLERLNPMSSLFRLTFSFGTASQ